MRPHKLFSVGVVSLLVVLASATGVAFTAQQTTPTATDTANADLSGVPAQQDSPGPTTAETEPNDDRANATSLTNIGVGSNGQFVGGNAYGNLSNESNESTDVDFFSFNATAGQAINLYSQGSYLPEGVSGDADGVQLTLYSPSGEAVASIGSGPGDIFTTGTVASETGTYYVRVNGSVFGSENAYDFGYEVADPNAFEPNDDTGNATPVEAGERVNGTVTNEDVDFFAVDADAGQTVTGNVQLGSLPTDNPGNVRVDIVDQNGDRISETYPVDSENEPSGVYSSNRTAQSGNAPKDTASANATIEESGTYYVRVTGVTDTGGVEDVQGFVPYELAVGVNGTAATTTTETATQTATETQSTSTTDTTTATDTATATTIDETATATDTETAAAETPTTAATTTEAETNAEHPSTAATTAYYQVDFVTGDAIENLRSDEGYYTPDRLIRFAHGDTDEGVTRVSDGEFVTDETVADRIESEDITVEDGTATITFTVTEGEPIELTLASYEKTGPGWNPQTEADQEFIDNDTGTFNSGTHTLTVDLPNNSDE